MTSKPSGVRVKPLVWTSHKFSLIGKGCFGAVFTISQRDNGFHVSTDSGLGVTLKTLDGAKRFYEDEYQQFVSQALEPAQPDPLGAAWMREQAARLIETNLVPCQPAPAWSDAEKEGYKNGQFDAALSFATAIRAIPDQTHADLLAQALKLPEVAALVDRSAQAAVDWLNGDYGIDEADAAELGIDGFIRAAATGTKEGE